MTEALKPCPFCDDPLTTTRYPGGIYVEHVRNTDCAIHSASVEVGKWNRRALSLQADGHSTPPLSGPSADTTSAAWADVIAERRRQVNAEGWTPAHDDEHTSGEMARAAACYALYAAGRDPWRLDLILSRLWPWCRKWWKPKNRRRDLVRAGALLLAEIERLDRHAAQRAALQTASHSNKTPSPQNAPNLSVAASGSSTDLSCALPKEDADYEARHHFPLRGMTEGDTLANAFMNGLSWCRENFDSTPAQWVAASSLYAHLSLAEMSDIAVEDAPLSGLLPCPFCGSPAQFCKISVELEPQQENAGGEYVECTERTCEMTTRLMFAEHEDVKPLLAEAWNRRTPAAGIGTPSSRTSESDEQNAVAPNEQGWVSVPREPTRPMLIAAWNASTVGRSPEEDRAVYKAMLAAAPPRSPTD